MTLFGKKKEEKTVLGNLVDGLPVQEGTDLLVKLTPTGTSLIIPSTKQTFEVSFDKLDSFQYYNQTEMEKVISQSAPGMVIGAAAFGILGAMVGGRVKTKEQRTVHHFVVINYTSDGQKQIIIKTNDFFGAGQIVDYFKKLKPESSKPTTISL